jgi:hypothetical protein
MRRKWKKTYVTVVARKKKIQKVDFTNILAEYVETLTFYAIPAPL